MNKKLVYTLSLLLFFFSSTSIAETMHTVSNGETLSTIALHYFGKSSEWKKIADYNNLQNPNALRIGQKIRIPSAGETRVNTPSANIPPTRISTTLPSVSSSVINSAPDPVVQELMLVDASGEIELTRAGNRITISPGSRIKAGDTIRTNAFARALFSGMGGERYAIGPLSIIALKEISSSYADRRIIIRIDQGELDLVAPETPFMTRYSIETPTGNINTRFGSFLMNVTPPDKTAISVYDGEIIASAPRGDVNVKAGEGLVMRTLELPQSAAALPQEPGISIEPALASIIVAAAARKDQKILFDIFRDRDMQRHTVRRQVNTDGMGVAISRFELPAGSYWIACRSLSEEGLSSRFVMQGPVTLKLP